MVPGDHPLPGSVGQSLLLCSTTVTPTDWQVILPKHHGMHQTVCLRLRTQSVMNLPGIRGGFEYETANDLADGDVDCGGVW